MKNRKKKPIRQDKYWKDWALILSHTKRFKKVVEETRKKWKIPPSGLPRDKRADWYASLFDGSDINSSYYASSQNDLIPSNKQIRADLWEISDDFNLDNRWHIPLFFYIASGNVALEPPSGLPYPEIRINDARLPEDKWVIKRMWMEIHPDTTLKDIEAIWNRIMSYQEKMPAKYPERRRPIKGVKKYVKIRKLEDKNISQQDIADDHPELGFLTAKDIADFKKQIEKHFLPKK
ncbi:MAG: hypothetical protein V1697_01855 [Candidatus Levyibacteriota bacterium]